MSSKSDVFIHPTNGTQVQTWTGFSFPAFLFGPFWAMHKGLYLLGILSLLTAPITAGLTWVFVGFIGNDQHSKSLLKEGYLPESAISKKKDQVRISAQRRRDFSVIVDGISG